MKNPYKVFSHHTLTYTNYNDFYVSLSIPYVQLSQLIIQCDMQKQNISPYIKTVYDQTKE